MKWDDLKFWSSDEWKTIQDKLDHWDRNGTSYNPNREDIFLALDSTPMEDVKVVLVGQDPYPNKKLATGLAFDIPPKETKFPITLHMILNEYVKDLHHPYPDVGSLSKWTQRGVLLLNIALTCEEGLSNSHRYLWYPLMNEIFSTLEGVVFVLMGSSARAFEVVIDSNKNKIISTSHPSPRGNLRSRSPFTGSRIFSTANGMLIQLGKSPVNWRL